MEILIGHDYLHNSDLVGLFLNKYYLHSPDLVGLILNYYMYYLYRPDLVGLFLSLGHGFPGGSNLRKGDIRIFCEALLCVLLVAV